MDKTTYHAVNETASRNRHVSPAQPRMGGQKGDIIFAFSLMAIPMSLFSALLLGLIFYFKVSSPLSGSPELQLPGAPTHDNVIYVNISATTLTTVASWSSTLAPILVGCAISLISYPVANRILRAGQSGKTGELPTPFQLGLMLKMSTSGSPQSLWNWVLTLVFAADTWFHFTTKSINLTQVYPTTSVLNTSVGLIPTCYNVNRTYQGGCTLNQGGSATFLMHGQQAQNVVANLSTTMRVNTIASGKDIFTYVGNPPKAALSNIDYQSHTWGLKTQCTPVTSQCVNASRSSVGKYLDYKCPFAMEGRVSTDADAAFQNQFQMAYFTNSRASINYTGTTSLANPYYFASLALVNQNIGRSPLLINDPEIANSGHGASVIAVFCNTTVYDILYTSLNNTISLFDIKPANSTLTNIIAGTQQYTRVGDPNLIQGSSIAALIGSSAQDVADGFALTYSQVALGVASAAFEERESVRAQRRETILVAKVGVVSLAALLGANMALVVLGCVLLGFAVKAGKGETREVQARMSVGGVVASLFEGERGERPVVEVDDLFEERKGGRAVSDGAGLRVGVVKTESGGWRFGGFRTG
ncbi:uncharacterized protein RCO7_01693 [Rhynchosporium graminicola]|uniref:Uncharacterized protein n=1 Tax=Rhynchosporium graminicola TaxID=2792576 RepID=A0A1E1KSP1_9HELO|nr:uncharacterized protein RCO7_01693 [Rhynchosporium commune]